MQSAMRYIWAFSLLAAVGVGVVALHNWLDSQQWPLWLGPVIMVLPLVGMMGSVRWLHSQGWIKGFIWSRPEHLARREQELHDERIRIIAEAKRGK